MLYFLWLPLFVLALGPSPSTSTRMIPVYYSNLHRMTATGVEVEYDNTTFIMPFLNIGDWGYDNFESFRQDYPQVSIDTQGMADSPLTFGNVGLHKFGRIGFPTGNFDSSTPKVYIFVAKGDHKTFAYGVAVSIGVGTGIRDGKTLFLNPQIHAYLYSAGWTERTLVYGLEITGVTFYDHSEDFLNKRILKMGGKVDEKLIENVKKSRL